MGAATWAGDLTTRIGEETHLNPKLPIEIGGGPILWHIMQSSPRMGC
jgi:glucose-1-phosphate cytidylyltransferase